MSSIITKYRHDGNEYAIVDDGNGAPLRLVALGTVRDEPAPLILEPVRECEGQGRDGFYLDAIPVREAVKSQASGRATLILVLAGIAGWLCLCWYLGSLV